MLLKKPKFWDNDHLTFLSIIFFPISIIIQLLIKLKKFQSRKKYNLPIICVGNIYIGGTGKTPISIELFKFFKSIKKKPAFVKKYYSYLQDELSILRKHGKVFIDHSRVAAINKLSKNGYNIAISDDGLQDYSFDKKISIICFHSTQWMGNGLVIPSGPLRESTSKIADVECVMINGPRNLKREKFLLNINKFLRIFYFKYKLRNIDKFKNKKIFAFTGIGNPENFFNSLEENKINVVDKKIFPDHYKFNDQDIKNLIYKAKIQGANLATTFKDYMRLKNKFKRKVLFTQIEIIINKEKEFHKFLKQNI